MVRTQIYLEEDQHRILNDLADAQQRTMAALIREALAEYLVRRSAETDPLLDLFGLGASGISDGAVEHDRDIYGDG